MSTQCPRPPNPWVKRFPITASWPGLAAAGWGWCSGASLRAGRFRFVLCAKVAPLDVQKHSTDPAAKAYGIWSALRHLAARVGSCRWTDGRFWPLRTARSILDSTCRYRSGDSGDLFPVYQCMVILEKFSKPQDYYGSSRIAVIGRQHFCLSLLVLRSSFSNRLVSKHHLCSR